MYNYKYFNLNSKEVKKRLSNNESMAKGIKVLNSWGYKVKFRTMDIVPDWINQVLTLNPVKNEIYIELFRSDEYIVNSIAATIRTLMTYIFWNMGQYDKFYHVTTNESEKMNYDQAVDIINKFIN